MADEIEVHTTSETGPQPTLRTYKPLPARILDTGAHPTLAPSAAPVVSGKLGMVLAALAAAAGIAAPFLSAPASWIVAAVAMLVALLAGVAGFEMPRFTVGKPLVTGPLAATLGTGAVMCFKQAMTMPDGLERTLLSVAAILCAGLAGVPLPRPMR